MKRFRIAATVGVATANLFCLSVAFAGTTEAAPPIVVPQERNDPNLLRDLQGVPDNVRALIGTFNQVRDKYLQQQRLLLIKLHNASTPAERNQLRQDLQDNRQAFLTDLKSFRDELESDLQALKSKISNIEFSRIIAAAHDAAIGGGHRHRGQ